MSSEIGRIIDSYRLDALIGDGGMGTVYRAFDTNLERTVAIKLMHAHYARQSEFRTRLRQEAKTAASLDHPSIVRVLDYGETSELAYIVMEYVGGGSLRAHLKRLQERGRYLPLQQSLQIAVQIAEALAYAHERGLVHRDVKPSNIILKPLNRPDEPGEQPFRAVLTDFGLVKLLEGDSLTQSGITLGTPAYMSPEQCQGLDLDGRSDLYSLGIVLYELFTNRLPFQFSSLAEAIAAHMRGEMPIPLRELRPDIPAVVDALVTKSLAKAPADRFVSGEAMAGALRSALFSLSDAPTRVMLPEEEQSSGERPVEVPEGFALTIHTPGYGETEVVLARTAVTLGRDPENDIVLAAEGVSRYHARLLATVQGWTVMDLGGINGSRLNGRRLPPNEPTPFNEGDRLQIGPYELELVRSTAEARGEALAEQPTPPPMLRQETLDDEEWEPAGENGAPLALFLARDKVTVAPGQEAQFHLEIANQGEVDDRVTVLVQGVPESWVSAPDQFIGVPAGETVKVTIGVRPPRRVDVPTGRQRLRLHLRSQRYPAAEPEMSASVMITAFEALEATLSPQELTLPGTVRVALRNQGNAPLAVSVVGRDPEQRVSFQGEQGQIRLEPRQGATVDLALDAQRRELLQPVEDHPFAVEVVSRSGLRHTLTGEATIGPLLPPWLVYGALVLLVFICIFSGLFAIFGNPFGGGRSVAATRRAGTATALAAADLNTIVAATATIEAATRLAITPTSTGDRDEDGLSDAQEQILGTLPGDPDTDDDGLLDGPEALDYGCNPLERDSDGDLINDWEEVNLYSTECNDPDTDDDGVPDGVEITRGTDPLRKPEATGTSTPTPLPTTPVTPSTTPTPSNTPTATATNLPTATPTNTLVPSPTPSVTNSPTPTNTPIPPTATTTNTPVPTSTPTATLTPNPRAACFAIAPVIDGDLSDGIWAAAERFTFASAVEPERVVRAYLAKDERAHYFAFVVDDTNLSREDAVYLYLDAQRNQGDPDEADRLFIVERDGEPAVQRGVGNNGDLLPWEPYTTRRWDVVVDVPTPTQWVAEIEIEDAEFGGDLANPFGMMVQTLFGEEVVVWPEDADPLSATTWAPIDNPACP